MKKEHININDKNCYGCTACFNACPKKAIEMIENKEGFLYPKINERKCINCGICKKVCPFVNTIDNNNYKQKMFVAQSNDRVNINNSSSGGLFFEIAQAIIDNNGYICGCIMCDDFSVKHILTDDISEVKKMQGSKYVQSDLNNTFSLIKDKLNNSIPVLFTGTPCQVHGLKMFLGKEYDNLLTIDLICHGVPNQKVFYEYIKTIQKTKGPIRSFSFRNKKVNGWKEMGSIEFMNKKSLKKIKTSINNDGYYYMFLKGFINRMTCYNCKYKSSDRYADITLGDAWSFKYNDIDTDVNNGLSLVFINTQKGEKYFSNINRNLYYFEIFEKEKIIAGLNNKEIQIPEIRKNIFNDIYNEGFESVEKKVCKYKYITPFFKSLVPFSIKKTINNRRKNNEN